MARRDGRRVIAVGTTVVRALETVTDESGRTSPAKDGPASSSRRKGRFDR
jgi:S-adenosylmethionine:tRNA-ribosyltransferase-isomerase (queuine synthetase)